MTFIPLPDITGADAAVALSTLATQPLRARRVFLTAHGSSNARFGNSAVTATKGVELPADTLCVFSASDGDIGDNIDLTNAFVWVPSGTTLTRTIGV